MMRTVQLLLLLLLPVALVACPTPVDPVDDDDDDDGHDHDHGTGDSDTHIHGVHHWGSTEEIVVGTHTGLMRTEAGSDELVDLFPGPDFMGFVQSGFAEDTYWSSGHWGAAGMGLWGFAESTDGGVTWDEISLTGAVDFHQMAVSYDTEGGVAGRFADEIYLSTDSGRTWDTYTSPSGVVDMEILDLAEPSLLLATSGGILQADGAGLAVSTVLAGNTLSVDRWGAGWAVGMANGDVQLCDATFADCEEIDGPNSDGAFQSLDVAGFPDEIYVLTAASAVFHTDDRGGSWELIIQGE